MINKVIFINQNVISIPWEATYEVKGGRMGKNPGLVHKITGYIHYGGARTTFHWLTNDPMLLWEIFCNYSKNTLSSSCKFYGWGWQLRIRLSRSSQTHSTRLRSGDMTDQSRTLMLFLWRKFRVNLGRFVRTWSCQSTYLLSCLCCCINSAIHRLYTIEQLSFICKMTKW